MTDCSAIKKPSSRNPPKAVAVAFAFEKGSATLVDLLEAERTDNTVRMALAQAQSNTASAVADVVAAQNVISETALESNKR